MVIKGGCLCYCYSYEITLARKLIKKLSESERKSYYLELQKKVHYKNQRDNANTHYISDRMCNLTSLGMALEYLGKESPNANMQFEDYLESKREDDYPSDARTVATTWEKLASDFDIKMDIIALSTNEQEKLTNKLKPLLETGHGVILSVFSVASGRGHIVRLQEVTDSGIIVDDPFGRVNNFAQREGGGSGYTGTANTRESGSVVGEDNLWTWSNISETEIKFACSFIEKE